MSNTVYVGAPSVRLYMQHIKCFTGDHVASKKLLHDGPALKSKGHFKTVYSAEALCWVCGSARHDPRDCKILTSALDDYKSKYLHKGSSRVGGRNYPSRGRPSGRGGFTSRNNTRGGHHNNNNARGGHHDVHKDKHFKNSRTDHKPVNFSHNGAHAPNEVLPPPAYTPPPADNTMSVEEEHFAFKATCEHEDNNMYNVYPTCEGATFRKDKDEDELSKLIDHEFFGSDDRDIPYDSTPQISDDSDAEGSDYDPEEEMPPLIEDDIDAESSDSDSYSPSIYDDSSDNENDEHSPTPQASKLELDPATRKLLNAGAETINTDIEDPLLQPKLNDDPNLNVTFSDEEEDAVINVLPVPKYLLYLGWEAKIGFHDYIPLESTVYDIEDVKISIKGPIVLAAITEPPGILLSDSSQGRTCQAQRHCQVEQASSPDGLR